MKKCYIIFYHLYDYDGNQKLIGGIETYLQALAQVMIYNKIQPILIQKGNKYFEKQEDGLLIRAYPVKGKNISAALYNQIEGEISNEDILVWGLDRDSVKIKHERTISIQHGIPFDYYPLENKRRKLYLKLHLGKVFKTTQRHLAIKAFENSKFKVCVDYNFWNWYRTFCLPGEERNIFVIPNFAELPKNKVERNYEGNLKVLFARRFVRMRGVEVFVDVVKKLKNVGGLEFTFAGEGPYQSEIEKLAKDNKNVKITRYNPSEAIDFHSKYDIAVVPTIASEGTSLSLLEAMSAGNAVIATCVGGMTNIILDGYNGLFVRPNNSDEIVDAILKLKNDKGLLKRLSSNGQLTIENSFSFNVWRERWSRVIKTVLEN